MANDTVREDTLQHQHHHRRQPSINSQTFAVPEDDTERDEGGDDDASSTDSYKSRDEATPFDPVEYLTESLDNALTRLEFNRSIAIQAQTSGKLRSKELELLTLQDEARARLVEFQQSFSNGLKSLQRVSKDLKVSQQKVKLLTQRVDAKYPIEYSQARDKVVSRNVSPAGGDDDNEIYI